MLKVATNELEVRSCQVNTVDDWETKKSTESSNMVRSMPAKTNTRTLRCIMQECDIDEKNLVGDFRYAIVTLSSSLLEMVEFVVLCRW